MTDNSSTQPTQSTVEALTTALFASPSAVPSSPPPPLPPSSPPSSSSSSATPPTTSTGNVATNEPVAQQQQQQQNGPHSPTRTATSTTTATTPVHSFGPPQRVRIKLHLRVGEPRSRLRQLKDLPDPPEWQHDLKEDSYDILMARIGDRVAMYPKYRWPGEGYLCIQPTKNSPQRAYEDVTRQTYKNQLLRAYAAEIKRLVLPEEVRINLFAYVETPLELMASSSLSSPSAAATVPHPVGKGRGGGSVATGAAGGERRGVAGGGSVARGRGAEPTATTTTAAAAAAKTIVNTEEERRRRRASSPSSPYPPPGSHQHGARPIKRSALVTLPSPASRDGAGRPLWTAGQPQTSRLPEQEAEKEGDDKEEGEEEDGAHSKRVWRWRRKQKGERDGYGEKGALEDLSGYGEKRSPVEEEDQLEPSEYEPRYDGRYPSPPMLTGVEGSAAIAAGSSSLSPARATPAAALSEDMEVDEIGATGMYPEAVDDFREIEIEIQNARLSVRVSVASLRRALGLVPPPATPRPEASVPRSAVEAPDKISIQRQ